MGFRIAYVPGGCAVFHEVDDILTEIRKGIPDGKVLTEEEARAYKTLLLEKGLGTPFEADVVRLTTIVLCFEGAIHGVRAQNFWMGDDEVRACLDRAVGLGEGINVVFNRIVLNADTSDSKGGWVSAYRRNGRWDISSGGGYDGVRS